jgi:hypothetical protein
VGRGSSRALAADETRAIGRANRLAPALVWDCARPPRAGCRARSSSGASVWGRSTRCSFAPQTIVIGAGKARRLEGRCRSRCRAARALASARRPAHGARAERGDGDVVAGMPAPRRVELEGDLAAVLLGLAQRGRPVARAPDADGRLTAGRRRAVAARSGPSRASAAPAPPAGGAAGAPAVRPMRRRPNGRRPPPQP